jgi:hypothetical protein
MGIDNPWLVNLQALIPFVAYYLGIVIRKKALPSRDSASLPSQLLLGIPVSLIVATPFVPILRSAFATSDPMAYLVTVGIAMEHGMVVPETVTGHLRQLLERARA